MSNDIRGDLFQANDRVPGTPPTFTRVGRGMTLEEHAAALGMPYQLYFSEEAYPAICLVMRRNEVWGFLVPHGTDFGAVMAGVNQYCIGSVLEDDHGEPLYSFDWPEILVLLH